MRSDEIEVIGYNAQQTHQAITEQVWPLAKAHNMAGSPVVITCKTLESVRSIQRNREYWGFVLKPISEQAQLGGMGATVDGWHDWYRLMFLGYEFRSVRLPGKKRPSVRKALKSTTKLSEKAMREYCEKVRAHAATTFGVEFPALEMDTGSVRRVVDADAGEITEHA